MRLLTTENSKTIKGRKRGYLTGILYLAPAYESGRINVCPNASKGCTNACLFTAGRGAFSNVRRARIRKTLEFAKNPKAFVEELDKDIRSLILKCKRLGLKPCVRLNGTSDLPWENLKGEAYLSLMHRFPKVRFYDYTKSLDRAMAYALNNLPKNYSLTFSRSESNDPQLAKVLKTSVNAAVVFSTKRGEKLPKVWAGRRVIDGDLTDLRFLDDKGCIVGLRSKGRAKQDESGFVVSVDGLLTTNGGKKQ